MGIGPKTIAVSGVGNTSWLGSRHAVAEAHPGTLDAAAFAGADGVEDGVVPSGYPVALVDDVLVPFDAEDGEEGDGPAATLHGFTLYDRDINDGDEPTAVVWHGRVRVANLPVTFDPATASGSAFVFDTEGV